MKLTPKIIAFVMLASVLCGGASTAWSGARSSSTTITINLTVDKFAEWADSGQVVVQSEWPAVTQVGQSRSVTKPLTLYTNADANIVAEAGANGGILRLGSQSLTTEYKLTGKLANPDSRFKPAGSSPGEFFNSGNVYRVIHEEGVGIYPLALDIQATSPSKEAVDPGVYSCSIILTVGW
jgi:hypothetical protein